MSPRIAAELRHLFGPALLAEAERTDPVSLDLSAALMDAVHDAADTLLSQRGDVSAQRGTVAQLPSEVRLVLCMWLMDTGLAAKLIRAAYVAA
jgi:hypothetical protein